MFTQKFAISVGSQRETYLITINEIQLARGGARPNAGRKVGTLNRLDRELLDRAIRGRAVTPRLRARDYAGSIPRHPLPNRRCQGRCALCSPEAIGYLG